jgi:hypothetical protein
MGGKQKCNTNREIGAAPARMARMADFVDLCLAVKICLRFKKVHLKAPYVIVNFKCTFALFALTKSSFCECL